MKACGFIKKIYQKPNIMIFYVDGKMWTNTSIDDLYNIVDTIEEYSLLRGCEYSEFKNTSNNKLLYTHKANLKELPNK